MEIWSDVLKLDQSALDVETSFFGMGGHSLLVNQVISRIKAQLKVDISYRDFFVDSSIQGAARIIEARAARLSEKRVLLI